MKYLFCCLFAFLLFSSSLFSKESFPDIVKFSPHDIIVTKNVDESNEWKKELIMQAKKTIEISTIPGGVFFRSIVDLLMRSLKNNSELVVYLFLEQMPTFTSADNASLVAAKKAFPHRFHYLLKKAVPTIHENTAYLTENHTKLLIVDEQYFVIGGTVMTEHLASDITAGGKSIFPFLPRGALDMDIVGKGSAAQDLRLSFFQLYELLESGTSLDALRGPFHASLKDYTPVDDKDKAFVASFENSPHRIAHVPLSAFISGPRMNYGAIGKVYKTLIDNAQKEIVIAHMFFFPADSIYDSLIQASNNHIPLTLITNGTAGYSTASTNLSFIVLNRYRYLPVTYGKKFKFIDYYFMDPNQFTTTKIYEMKRGDIMYHKKVMVTDGRYAITGSYNLGFKSEFGDFESVVIVDSEAASAAFLSVLENDKRNSRLVTNREIIDWHFTPAYRASQAFSEFFLTTLVL